MKRFKAERAYLAFMMLILIVFLITGCGSSGGSGQTGHCLPSNPTVTLTAPADAAAGILTNTTITVTFSKAMNPATVTVQASDGVCTDSVQISDNDFTTCVGGTINTSDNTTFTIDPTADLVTCDTYKVRVTTSVTDSGGTAMAAQFTQPNGFDTQSVISWTEDAGNPIILGHDTVGVDRAYYPYVIKAGNTYHIWYGDGKYTRHATSYYYDFRDVAFPAPLVTGLSGTYEPYHPRVKYSAGGWTIGGSFYAGPFLMYYTNSAHWTDLPRIAHSADGQAWTDIGVTTGVSNGGDSMYSFDVLYEGGTDWKAYRDDGGANILYFTSTNGIDWTIVSAAILGTYQAWESSIWKNISPSIYKIGTTYVLFFSGGLNSNDQGFGLATSTDGSTFTKSASNPIFSINDGVPWRDVRTYTSSVVQSGSGWYVYFTGRTNTPSISYSVGVARKCGSLY